MSLIERLNALKEELDPGGCTLVAVSKTKPPSLIMEAYDAGHRDFGENKVQDLAAKYEELPRDIRWHMIGHLQRNKVKYIAPFVQLIHGVDSEKLLREIDKEAGKNDRVIECLFQVHIASEATKFGFDSTELFDLIRSGNLAQYGNVRMKGLMGMATFTDDDNLVRQEFRRLSDLFNSIKQEVNLNNFDFTILSMGMSGDYKIALEEGSNMVRIGTTIFGERNYLTQAV